MPQAEQPLFGGLTAGRVVRVGDTVRRPAGAWTATLQALLKHLESRGFPAPRPLGLDEAGRETVSWLAGDCSNWPWPPTLLDVSGARQIGAMLRRYHQAVEGFAPPSPPVWRHGPQDLAPGEIVLHGDFGPHNLIWTGNRLTGVIDFELARPGQPIEDAGFAAARAACFRTDEKARKMGFASPPDRRARLAAFAEGYGVGAAELLAAARQSMVDEAVRIARLGGAGIEPWSAFMGRGLLDDIAEELAWLEAHAGALV